MAARAQALLAVLRGAVLRHAARPDALAVHADRVGHVNLFDPDDPGAGRDAVRLDAARVFEIAVVAAARRTTARPTIPRMPSPSRPVRR